MKRYQLLKKTTQYLLLLLTIIFLITGYGVTEHRLMQTITFSLLTKPVSHVIHINLIMPFIMLLILHIALSIKPKFFRKILGEI